MKVFELFEETKDKYFNRLIATLNIARLGKGAFGHVFQHPTFKDVVVKIFSTEEDPRFAKYIQWCRQNQSNPWVPKIMGVTMVDMPNEQGFDEHQQMFVFMEKLSMATSADVKRAVKRFVGYVPMEVRTVTMKNAISLSNFRVLKSADWKLIALHTEGDDKVITTRLARIGDRNLDIHGKNVMMRGSQLVFTDPTA